MGGVKLFRSIDIETSNICNRRCSYCPVSLELRGPDTEMPWDLMVKIAQELGALGYAGKINSNMYNEPLMDTRLPQFYLTLKTAAPRCHIRLLTNGDYLTPEKMDELFSAGMDSIRITDHNPVSNPRLQKLMEYARARYPQRDITLNRLDGQLRNRGGTIDHAEAQAPALACWPRGGSRAYIDFRGNMIGCCDDPFSTKIFGNVATQKIIDVWNSQAYRRFRDGLNQGVYYYEFCRKCNYNAGKEIALASGG